METCLFAVYIPDTSGDKFNYLSLNPLWPEPETKLILAAGDITSNLTEVSRKTFMGSYHLKVWKKFMEEKCCSGKSLMLQPISTVRSTTYMYS